MLERNDSVFGRVWLAAPIDSHGRGFIEFKTLLHRDETTELDDLLSWCGEPHPTRRVEEPLLGEPEAPPYKLSEIKGKTLVEPVAPR
jgi:hypothetical protein